MRMLSAVLGSAMLLSACGSSKTESLTACIGRFSELTERVPVTTNIESAVYTYDISDVPDEGRAKLMQSGKAVIVAGENSQRLERDFLRDPVGTQPRMLLADRSIYRIRQPGRGRADATIAFGCRLLDPKARLIAVDMTFAPPR